MLVRAAGTRRSQPAPCTRLRRACAGLRQRMGGGGRRKDPLERCTAAQVAFSYHSTRLCYAVVGTEGMPRPGDGGETMRPEGEGGGGFKGQVTAALPASAKAATRKLCTRATDTPHAYARARGFGYRHPLTQLLYAVPDTRHAALIYAPDKAVYAMRGTDEGYVRGRRSVPTSTPHFPGPDALPEQNNQT